MDVRARRAAAFGQRAQAYDRGRPEYPREAVEACVPQRARRVLDLGAGTGKLTRGLVELGLDVVAVEPLEEMRALLPAESEALAGSAEAIPLPDASVDAVLAGQAFHWFDAPRALAEIARVLRSGGTLGLLWNLLDDRVPLVAAIADAFDAEDRVSLAEPGVVPFSGAPGLSDPERLLVPHAQAVDAGTLVDNIASRSTTILRPEAEQAALIDRIRQLAPPGPFELPHVCEVWIARRAPLDSAA